jgi:ribonuclease HI/exonuclease III
MSDTTDIRETRMLRIWQQNLNRSLEGQLDLLQSLKDNDYDIVALQEPHIDFLGRTRANPHWTVVYPRQHLVDPSKTRAIILVNRKISTNNWDEIPLGSTDVTGVCIHGVFGAIYLLNIYNDCENNRSLGVVKDFMRGRGARVRVGDNERYIWLGDFNRHHPIWDEERNAHLFTRRALEAAQPLLDLIGRYDMHMALPKDIPTLEACATKNFTRVDNVFCSAELVDTFVSCDTFPQWRPQKTDHMPIISVLEIEPERIAHVGKHNFKLTDWEEFRKSLGDELEAVEDTDEITTEDQFYARIAQVDKAIKTAIRKHVPLTRLSPYSKRWWNKELTGMKRDKEKLARKSYTRRALDNDPIHEEFRQARNIYSKAIRDAKSEHWLGWLETLDEEGVWAANRMATGPAADGGRGRIPTLQVKDPITKRVTQEARTNEEKGRLLYQTFFPRRTAPPAPVPEEPYPQAKWEYVPTTDEQIHRAIKRMKPWKATRTETVPNAVFVYARELLVPFLGPIFRATDMLKLYPDDWKLTETPILKKPGKADYTAAGAWRPIVLSNGLARLLNGCKTEDLVLMCEKSGILPQNHFGGRPGRATTDSVHLLVKTVKDAWRKREVASLLCLDVKGAFPSAAVDVLLHEMRMCGVPSGHVEWFERRLQGRKTSLIFDDFKSETFNIEEGIDQGDAQSLIAWIIYNHQILKIFNKASKETGFLYVDDTAVLVTGKNFSTTHTKLRNVMNRTGGIMEWAVAHNCSFGIDKFQLLDLSRKKVKDPLRPRKRVPLPRRNLLLNGQSIKSATTVKFLGLHIDRELRWKEQIAAAIGKGREWLRQCSRLAKTSGGISGRHMRKLYLAVVRPRMLYGADIFLGPALRSGSFNNKKGSRAALNKLAAIQRSAAISIVGGLRTSPTDSLDIHANLLPFHLMVDKTRFQAALRLATLPETHPLYKPVHQAAQRFVTRHHSPLHELMHRFKLKPKLMERIAASRQGPKWESDVAIRIADNKEMAKEEDRADETSIKVYTDGSGFEGKVGAAAVLYRNGVLTSTRRMHLGSIKHHTVYEGEGVGLILGLELIREEGRVEGMVSMGSDNTAAVCAVHAIKPSPSHYIWDMFHKRMIMVQNKHRGMDLLVKWVPGHMDIDGNERADEEAKKAATDGSSPLRKLPAPLRKTLPRSKSAVQQEYRRKINLAAIEVWARSPRFDRMALVDPDLSHVKFAKLTLSISRNQASILFQLRSGHVPLNTYLHRIKKADSPVCPSCHQYRETVMHYIMRCEAHTEARQVMFSAAGRDARNLGKLLSTLELLPHLFRYIRSTERLRLSRERNTED